MHRAVHRTRVTSVEQTMVLVGLAIGLVGTLSVLGGIGAVLWFRRHALARAVVK